MSSVNVDKVYDALVQLNVAEICELNKKLEEQLGVSFSSFSAPAPAAGAGGGGAEPAVAEKTSFSVVLKEVGQNKIALIKLVKDLTGKSLMDARKLVDTEGAILAENVSKEDADSISTKVQEVGASVEVK